MSIFEDNMKVLRQKNQEIYRAISAYEDEGLVGVEEAADGEPILILSDENCIYPLNSIYHPQHEIERFLQQFERVEAPQSVLVVGFGSGMAVRGILEDADLFERCIVYEPFVPIIYAALNVYDLRQVLSDERLELFVEGVNEAALYSYLNEVMDYSNWQYYRYVSLPRYNNLYAEQAERIRTVFQRLQAQKKADLNTMLHFAKKGSENEIQSFKWLINGRSAYELSGHITDRIPCIIVASGPSLEKNLHELKDAKGKAFILCVDSAAQNMAEKGILPDAICTIDPDKRSVQLNLPELQDIPILMTPESNHDILDSMTAPKVMCYSAGNAFHHKIFEKYNCPMPYFEGGGSVATNCFKLAIELGFRTVILVGQDLAIQGDQIHAYRYDQKRSQWKQLEVEGYYGTPVVTLSDFKLYLEYYEALIPQLEDKLVINATEGGAKIHGAVQMPLAEAIRKYCIVDFEFKEIFSRIPEVWKDREAKNRLYQDLKKHRSYLCEIQERVEIIRKSYGEFLQLLEKNKIGERDAKWINRQMQEIMSLLEEGEDTLILYRRMIRAELELRHKMYELSLVSGSERDRRLAEVMLDYLNEVQANLSEILEQWNRVFLYLDKESGF